MYIDVNMPQYLLLSRGMESLDTTTAYMGPVIGGPDFIVAVPQSMTTRAMQTIGTQGVLGKLIATAAGKPKDDLETFKVTLPDEMLAHPDYPGDRQVRDGLVFFQADMRDIRMNWKGQLSFRIGGKQLQVTCGIFNKGKIRGFLESNGYVVA